MKFYGIILSFFALCLAPGIASADETAGNGIVSVSVSGDGRLTSLTNLSTGHNYAGGEYLWRMYYDSPERKEIEISGAGQKAETSLRNGTIEVFYPNLVSEDGSTLDISLTLRISPDGKAETVPVRVLFEFDSRCAVDAKLEAGDKIVVDGMIRLAPGVPVTIVQ